MMRKIILLLLIFSKIAISEAQDLTKKDDRFSFDDLPEETILVPFSKDEAKQWKDITHIINNKDGIIESIPKNQTASNWTELVTIQYTAHDHCVIKSLDEFLEGYFLYVKDLAPAKKVELQIIEKNDADAIYEQFLEEADGSYCEHQVVRVFRTSEGFHTASFTKKVPINSEEKEIWIKKLKEASIVSFLEAKKSSGLSFMNSLEGNLRVDIYFKDWIFAHSFINTNGYTTSCIIPPHQLEANYLMECLEVCTLPIGRKIPVSQLFEIEKENINRNSPVKVTYHVLYQSSSEIIYAYDHPKDHLQLNAVVRIISTDNGYYSLNHKIGLNRKMKISEMHFYKEKLRNSICVIE